MQDTLLVVINTQNASKYKVHMLYSLSIASISLICVFMKIQLTRRYIAQTLYGEDNDDDTQDQQKRNVEEPKLLGLHPGSEEKVHLMIICVDCLQ